MYKLSLKNAKGDEIKLTGNLNYSITDISGLHPASATIATSELAMYDGSTFNSSKVNEKQIDINVAIECDAEKNRIALYKVIKVKQYIKLLYENDTRDVFIEGYVSDMQIDFFSIKQTATISILCLDPYFKDAQEIIDDISATMNAFHFPFAITATDKKPLSYRDNSAQINVINNGDVETGMIIEIHASGNAINPAIYNRETGEFFKMETTLQSGDTLYINTIRKQKSARVLRSGEFINLFNYISKESTWLQLEPGDNVFIYEGDSGSSIYMSVRFVHQQLFEGV